MKKFGTWSGIIAVSLVGSLTASTYSVASAEEFDTHAQRCNLQADIDPDLKIGSCTWLLNSGQLDNGGNATVFMIRGDAYNAKNDIDRAISDLDQATRLDPNFFFAFFFRALLHERKRDYARAIEDLDRALLIDPDVPYGYRRRGAVWAAVNNYERAIADYKESIRLDPDSRNQYEVYNDLAWLYATARDRRFRNATEAVDLAQKAVALNDTDPAIHDTLAAAYVEADRPDDALVSYRRAMELGGESHVRRYQEDLKKKGHYLGQIDGQINPLMDAALSACVAARCQLNVD